MRISIDLRSLIIVPGGGSWTPVNFGGPKSTDNDATIRSGDILSKYQHNKSSNFGYGNNIKPLDMGMSPFWTIVINLKAV